MTTIYTLELENGKYYIGRSNIPKIRILNHFLENGSEWTKKYKPINILSQNKGDAFDEEKYTLLAMEKYGIDNVRGGSYCKIKLSQNDKDKALQTIRSITDKCYKCGESNHFAKECDLIKKTKSTIKYTDEYENFISKCEGDCEQCNNTRICYQYYDGEDYIYTSCMFCYSGDDWESDMFVELHKQRL